MNDSLRLGRVAFSIRRGSHTAFSLLGFKRRARKDGGHFLGGPCEGGVGWKAFSFKGVSAEGRRVFLLGRP